METGDFSGINVLLALAIITDVGAAAPVPTVGINFSNKYVLFCSMSEAVFI